MNHNFNLPQSGSKTSPSPNIPPSARNPQRNHDNINPSIENPKPHSGSLAHSYAHQARQLDPRAQGNPVGSAGGIRYAGYGNSQPPKTNLLTEPAGTSAFHPNIRDKEAHTESLKSHFKGPNPGLTHKNSHNSFPGKDQRFSMLNNDFMQQYSDMGSSPFKGNEQTWEDDYLNNNIKSQLSYQPKSNTKPSADTSYLHPEMAASPEYYLQNPAQKDSVPSAQRNAGASASPENLKTQSRNNYPRAWTYPSGSDSRLYPRADTSAYLERPSINLPWERKDWPYDETDDAIEAWKFLEKNRKDASSASRGAKKGGNPDYLTRPGGRPAWDYPDWPYLNTPQVMRNWAILELHRKPFNAQHFAVPPDYLRGPQPLSSWGDEEEEERAEEEQYLRPHAGRPQRSGLLPGPSNPQRHARPAGQGAVTHESSAPSSHSRTEQGKGDQQASQEYSAALEATRLAYNKYVLPSKDQKSQKDNPQVVQGSKTQASSSHQGVKRRTLHDHEAQLYPRGNSDSTFQRLKRDVAEDTEPLTDHGAQNISRKPAKPEEDPMDKVREKEELKPRLGTFSGYEHDFYDTGKSIPTLEEDAQIGWKDNIPQDQKVVSPAEQQVSGQVQEKTGAGQQDPSKSSSKAQKPKDKDKGNVNITPAANQGNNPHVQPRNHQPYLQPRGHDHLTSKKHTEVSEPPLWKELYESSSGSQTVQFPQIARKYEASKVSDDGEKEFSLHPGKYNEAGNLQYLEENLQLKPTWDQPPMNREDAGKMQRPAGTSQHGPGERSSQAQRPDIKMEGDVSNTPPANRGGLPRDPPRTHQPQERLHSRGNDDPKQADVQKPDMPSKSTGEDVTTHQIQPQSPGDIQRSSSSDGTSEHPTKAQKQKIAEFKDRYDAGRKGQPSSLRYPMSLGPATKDQSKEQGQDTASHGTEMGGQKAAGVGKQASGGAFGDSQKGGNDAFEDLISSGQIGNPWS